MRLPEKWCEAFADCVRRDCALRELTSVRVGGKARWLLSPVSDEQTGTVLRAIRREGLRHLVLGGGSNLLPPDGTLDAVVIHAVELRGFEVAGEEVTVGAGLPLSAFVARVGGLGLEGAHVLAGIPGQVGGAIAMNAGGRYGEIGSLVRRVHARLADGSPAVLGPADLAFGYRSSRLPPHAVVTSVVLRLRATDDARRVRREVGRIIKEKNAAQPTTSWNFGCMFKNPPETSAGILIDRAGLRGTRRGDARISPLHGNFVENLGEALAADVRSLIELAERTVEERCGVRLEREVRVW